MEKEMKEKNPIIAGLLSLFITGSGQWYIGKFGEFVQYLLVEIVMVMLGYPYIIPIFISLISYGQCRQYNEKIKNGIN